LLIGETFITLLQLLGYILADLSGNCYATVC